LQRYIILSSIMHEDDQARGFAVGRRRCHRCSRKD
jgi:hypothetical protein